MNLNRVHFQKQLAKGRVCREFGENRNKDVVLWTCCSCCCFCFAGACRLRPLCTFVTLKISDQNQMVKGGVGC